MYVANDGGDAVEVFELDRRCRVLRTLTGDVDPYDVEDLGRTPDGALWLSDTGDNGEDRPTVALEVLAPSGEVALYRMTYPDRAHDAEALLVGPDRRPYVVTKEPLGESGVYTPDGELSTRRPTPLRKVTTVRFGFTGTDGGPVGAASQTLVTGGAVSGDGRLVAVRTYTDLYVWAVPGGDIGAALSDGEPVRVPLPASEGQGEAVTFAPDGKSVYTMSEGSPSAVHVTAVPAEVLDGSSGSPGGAADSTDDPAGTADSEDSDGGGSTVRNAVLAASIAAVVVLGVGRLRRRNQ